ncbi:MAG TPA: TPM domain-containing protein, partial [Allosphingosinicella sp.]
MSLLRALLLLLVLMASPAAAQEFPALTGRVVDAANIIPDADEAALTQELKALERNSSRQLVVATVPSLGGYPIEDYGYQLGRHWGIGQKGANNGVILLVAPNERKVRIEVGYGLEPIMTDALSNQIITQQILPRFKADDYPGGIRAGAAEIVAQLQAPPEQAEQKALEAQQAAESRGSGEDDFGGLFPLIFWGAVLLFVFLRMIGRGGRRGRRHRRRGVWVWGPGVGGGDWGGGWGGSSSGGGFDFGGGGFSGGGGSFGGGGASGG